MYIYVIQIFYKILLLLLVRNTDEFLREILVSFSRLITRVWLIYEFPWDFLNYSLCGNSSYIWDYTEHIFKYLNIIKEVGSKICVLNVTQQWCNHVIMLKVVQALLGNNVFSNLTHNPYKNHGASTYWMSPWGYCIM